jgi:hypothetical protein
MLIGFGSVMLMEATPLAALITAPASMQSQTYLCYFCFCKQQCGMQEFVVAVGFNLSPAECYMM